MGVSGTASGMVTHMVAIDALLNFFLVLPCSTVGVVCMAGVVLGLSPLLTGVAGGRSLSKCSGFSCGPNDTFFLLASEASSIVLEGDAPPVGKVVI